MSVMQLAVSNIAWSAEETRRVLGVLKALGAAGVEVAPTRIAEWDDLDEQRLKIYRREIEGEGLRVSSLQAILFGKPGATLLGDEAGFDALLEHMAKVSDIAETLGAGTLVFGAPKNRLRGALSPEEARALGRERFGRLAAMLSGRSVVIGIEPVPAFYGGDFLASAQSVIDMVRLVNAPNIRVHLDTGCAKLGGDDIGNAIRAAGDLLCHFHAAEPNLRDFSAPAMDHSGASQALRDAHYGRWVAIEMRDSPEKAVEAVRQAVQWVSRTYAIGGFG